MTRRPTILQIIPRLDTGGAELSAIEINEAVVRGGGRSIVATEGGRMADRIAADGGELVIMQAGSKNPLRMAANIQSLARLIRTEGVDLIHARSRAPAWSAFAASSQTAKPFVTTYHGAYAEKGPIKRLYNSVMARSDIVIANSHYTSRLIQSRYGIPDARIRVIHRGVDEARFNPSSVTPERIQDLRTQFAIGANDQVIVQAARLTSWKGQSVLIDAAAQLARTSQLGNAVVLLIGDDQGRDDYTQRLTAQIKGYGLEQAIRLGGHVDDIPAALMLAWVSVIASTEPEAFGRSVTEAAAMGCPAIATDIGAPPETVKAPPHVGLSEATGWLVAPGDADALSRQLKQALMLSSTERAAMGARARTHALKHFSLTSMKRATLSVYDELLFSNLHAQFDANSAGKISTTAT